MTAPARIVGRQSGIGVAHAGLAQRGDHDARLLSRQGVGQLLGGVLDALHHPVGVLELVHGVLQLAIQHDPVGDDDHLVEHLVVGVVVEVGKAVGQPGDRVGLARPR